MDVNGVHRYSHLGKKLLRITYKALGVKLTCTPKVCDGCARSKSKSRVVRKKTYKRAPNAEELVFVDKNSPLLESLIGDR